MHIVLDPSWKVIIDYHSEENNEKQRMKKEISISQSVYEYSAGQYGTSEDLKYLVINKI
jgi:hypothetical protein